MNKTIVSIVLCVFLLLFIFSPFAAFSGLLLILFVSVISSLFVNIFQALLGKNTDNSNSNPAP
ncbi:hypothetical protein [Dulcicalothrix desertica]|uniref:hypothetical protein n=1 Tax=Dulcicalothrix desertica TaxID=32056 RepID=UPI000F8E31CA|nr:hypothetical protein [Dulcicalothrix desertica]TWH55655.1 hypothetical protein CAL7102_03813 [Dulcicalothrix desertica PCC 7102]